LRSMASIFVSQRNKCQIAIMLFTIQVNNKKIKPKRVKRSFGAQPATDNNPDALQDERIHAYGACRMCVVEVEGHERLVTACSHPLWNG